MTSSEGRAALLPAGIGRGEGRFILVLGAGTTGLGVALSLAKAGVRVLVIDEARIKAEQKAKFADSKIELLDEFRVEAGSERLSKALFAISSPGIKLESGLLNSIKNLNIEVISELDWACAFLGRPEVAVTGTNGKTTTVSLIYKLLLAAGENAKLLGNIGEPLSAAISAEIYNGQQKRDYSLVCEISSFQLAHAEEFASHVGVWLNLEDDHNEWHGSFQDYATAKTKITSGQGKEDYLVINVDDKNSSDVIKKSNAQIIFVGVRDSVVEEVENSCFYFRDSKLIVYSVGGKRIEFSTEKWRPRGEHNKINLCAAIASVLLLGVAKGVIEDVIATFVLSAHRIALVPSDDGKVYIDDSKGTNVSAVVAAMKTVFEDFPKSSIVLILGGVDKDGSWQPVADLLDQRVKKVVCCGGDGPKIYKALAACSPLLVVDLPQAVKAAKDILEKGDVLLFSPGCSSFDAYSGYAQRGEHFCQLVRQ
ncbi:MAG: UDP-N-acetylmuramoyl-L-alanine--D-glutamate ligase [Deltaproteobacteria bacterium]|nr:UDP-N-acetylmuramoyl-L-alanine--D-glutamate ligase [Deltaproteobacteria bacterium]